MPLWKKKKAAEPAAPLDVLRWKIVAVNILFADTRDIDGIAYGQMLLELPDDARQAEKVLAWLRAHEITCREEA